MGSYLSIITLNVNGLNTLTKRQTLDNWIQKQNSCICCVQDTHLKPRDIYRLKVRGRKNIFHVNRMNAPTKRQRLAEWIQKQDPYICCLQETHLKPRDANRLKVKGWKEIFHANGDQKEAGVAIIISDKIDFEIKAVKRDKVGHYIMIKGSIQEEDITIINIYAPNIGAPQYVRQILTSMEWEINNNIPHSHLWMDQLNRKLTKKHKL